jgi:hypothetical protein
LNFLWILILKEREREYEREGERESESLRDGGECEPTEERERVCFFPELVCSEKRKRDNAHGLETTWLKLE